MEIDGRTDSGLINSSVLPFGYGTLKSDLSVVVHIGLYAATDRAIALEKKVNKKTVLDPQRMMWPQDTLLRLQDCIY